MTLLEPGLAEEIRQSVAQGMAAQLAFTQTLVRFPSVRGQEHTAQDFVFQAMKQRGLAMDRWT
ncbi:MAG: ArgE/DapE family deacylase, partial [Gammaproteobacteria bacterium]|nr:ArgE/DapE family deacylase [Gammaproteobacteria bacterium]